MRFPPRNAVKIPVCYCTPYENFVAMDVRWILNPSYAALSWRSFFSLLNDWAMSSTTTVNYKCKHGRCSAYFYLNSVILFFSKEKECAAFFQRQRHQIERKIDSEINGAAAVEVWMILWPADKSECPHFPCSFFISYSASKTSQCLPSGTKFFHERTRQLLARLILLR